MTLAKEPVLIVEIDLPLCSLTFGVNDGDETGCFSTFDTKCWNTDATCTYRLGYDETETTTLRFVENRGWGWVDVPGAFQPALAIPALRSVRLAPTVLNIAGGSEDRSPLGVRAVARMEFDDFPYNDVGIDPYLADRDYDPLQQGTFWGKVFARWPFLSGQAVRAYEGFLGDALNDMIRRDFIISKGDRQRNRVVIEAKDVLSKITDTEVTIPRASPGELQLAMTNVQTTLQVIGATLDDYPATGYLRIGDELMSYTARTDESSHLEFTGVVRGIAGTVASEHDQFETAQEALRYEDEPFHNMLYEWLTEYIATSFITKADWDEEQEKWRPLYRFTGWVTEPTRVQQLAAEVCFSAQAHIWWDERVKLIKLRAQRPADVPLVLDEGANIIADSVSIVERPEDRVTDVRIYYGPRSPIAPLDNASTYRTVAIFIDVDKRRQYGGPAVKEFFTRWVQTNAIAQALGNNYLRRFRDVPRELTVDVDVGCLSCLWTGDNADLLHFLDANFDGSRRQGNWLITSAETVEHGLRYRFKAEGNDSAGILWEWQDADTEPASWSAATAEQRETVPFWLDEEGNNPDGSPGVHRWL